MRTIKIFEDFEAIPKYAPKFDGYTLQDLQAKTPTELGWLVTRYPEYQPRAWGQWLEKQPEGLKTILGKLSKLIREWGYLGDKDVAPLGKFLLDPKNIQVLTDLVALFNREYPDVDYKQ